MRLSCFRICSLRYAFQSISDFVNSPLSRLWERERKPYGGCKQKSVQGAKK